MSKSVFNYGDLDAYQSKTKEFLSAKEDFEIVSSGLTRRIVLPNGTKLRFFGTKGKKNFVINGAYLVNMVTNDVDDYIEKHGIPKHKRINNVQVFNPDGIKKLLNRRPKPIVAIDINACYWNIAHNLGFLSDRLYNRGLEKASKEGLLIAVGCLNKKPRIKVYKAGELVENKPDENYYNRYSPFYWKIIETSEDIMMKTYELFKDNWYMYLTDCLYVDSKVSKQAQEFLASLGYQSKVHSVQFTGFDGKIIEWIDFKKGQATPKKMYYAHRDIKSAYLK